MGFDCFSKVVFICETCLQFESETLPEVETKEESDDEDEEDEESGRVRFRSERKEGVVVRLADANKRRNIPETLGTICSCPGYCPSRGALSELQPNNNMD